MTATAAPATAELAAVIEAAWENRAEIGIASVDVLDQEYRAVEGVELEV